MSFDPDWEACGLAFANRDYLACAQKALALQETAAPELRRLLAVSLERLGMTAELDTLTAADGRSVLFPLDDPWDNALMKLALGRESLENILPLAGDDARRCQAHFYHACRLLTEGHTDAAREAFIKSYQARPAGELFEGVLAALELNRLLPPAAEEPAAELQRALDPLYRRFADLFEAGHYEEALGPVKEACALVRRHRGENHPEYASALNLLARTYQEARQYEAAEPLFRQVVDIRRAAQGEDHPDYASALENLGGVRLRQGNRAAAGQLARQALEIRRRVLGENHPDVALSLKNLAWLHRGTGDFPEAERLYREALAVQKTALGARHPDYLGTLQDLADLLADAGRYTDAEPVYREVLDIRRATVGEGHREFARTAHQLAEVYRMIGRHADAGPLYRQALEVLRQTGGERSLEYANMLSNQAAMYHALGRHHEAEAGYRRSLDLKRSLLGENDPEYAATLNNLAVLYEEMGDFAAAEPLTRQAVEIVRRAKGEGDPQYGRILLGLGALYRHMGDYARAETVLHQSAEVLRRTGQTHHPAYASCLNNLGELYQVLGRYAEAESLYREAAEICRVVLGPGHVNYALSLSNVARLYEEQGHYKEAEPLYRQTGDMIRRACGDHHPLYAVAFNNLAGLYLKMSNYPAAEALYRQAQDIRRDTVGEHHPDFAGTLDNLAQLYSRQGDEEKAEPLIRQALDIRRELLGEDHPHFANSLSALAHLNQARGDYEEAEALYRQALEIDRRAVGENHPEFAAALNNLALLYFLTGDLTRAEPLMRQAVAIHRQALGEHHPKLAGSLVNLAIVCAALGRAEEALHCLEEGAAIDDQTIGQVFSLGSESQRAAYLAETQAHLEALLSLVRQYLADSQAAVNAALHLVLRRKAIGAEALAVQREAVLGGRYPELQSQLAELNTLRGQIARKALAGPGPEGPDAHRRLLTQWTADKEKLEADLARHIPEMSLERQLRAADRRAVALALPDGVALVEFVRFRDIDFTAVRSRGESGWQPPRYAAFVLHGGDPDRVALIDLGEAEPIDQLIADFRAGITGGSERRAARDLGAFPTEADPDTPPDSGLALREAVFDPLTAALADRRRLLLAPDGDLTRLPFGVLPTADGRRLVDAYEIGYLAAGRDVLRFTAPAGAAPGEAVVVADPDFDLSAGPKTPADAPRPVTRQSRDLDRGRIHFGRLPGTRVEGQRVAHLLGVQPWLAGTALEARLKACRSPRVLHLATHGFFLQDQPRPAGPEGPARHERTGPEDGLSRMANLENPLLRSGLALAGANTWLDQGDLPPEAEDGLLTAEDVTGLDLLNTELVVLSACETGLGEVRTGEGVFGLRRAFVLAGARTLVMSLWKVPDQQTQELMEDFYRRLTAGQGRADALREAQRSLQARYPEPLYWGAFICQGEPGPMKSPACLPAAPAPAYN